MKKADSSPLETVQPLCGKAKGSQAREGGADEGDRMGEDAQFLIEEEEEEDDSEDTPSSHVPASAPRPLPQPCPSPSRATATATSPRRVPISTTSNSSGAAAGLPSPRPHGITTTSTPRAAATEPSTSTRPAGPSASSEEEGMGEQQQQPPSSPSKLKKPKESAPGPGMMMTKGPYHSVVNPFGANLNIVANVAYMRKTQEVVKLRAWSTDGPAWARALGGLGGALLLAHHTYGFGHALHHITSDAPDRLLTSLLFHALGILLGTAALLLEGRSVLCPTALKKRSREYLKLLSFLWGRGCLYLLVSAILALRLADSSIHTTTNPTNSLVPTIDAALAAGFAVLGAADVGFGIAVQRRLRELRGHLMEDEQLIRAKFDRLDVDRRGRVPASDLAAVCAELGSRLSHQELEGAILTLDANRNGEVEYEAFVEWWRTR